MKRYIFAFVVSMSTCMPVMVNAKCTGMCIKICTNSGADCDVTCVDTCDEHRPENDNIFKGTREKPTWTINKSSGTIYHVETGIVVKIPNKLNITDEKKKLIIEKALEEYNKKARACSAAPPYCG